MLAMRLFVLIFLISNCAGDNGFGNELWRSKVKTMASMFDHDKDGYVSDEEIEDAKKSYAALYKGTDPTPFDRVIQAIDKQWESVTLNAPDRAHISYDDYANGVLAAGEDQCQSLMSPVSDMFFDLVDTNGDGQITRDEMEALLNTFTLATSDNIAQAFQAIDTDSNGVISKDEYTTAIVQYYCSGVSNPADVMFGPLVN